MPYNHKVMSRKKQKVISLYSGAGGLDIGLENAGFHVAVAVDFDEDSCRTLERNFKSTEIICGDIQEISTEEILDRADLAAGEADLLAGGPPCQPFSKSAFWNGSLGLSDPRAVTLREYVRVLKEAKPKAFILENVFGLAYKNHLEAFEYLLREFEKLGYHVSHKVINMADYGVPQTRQRLIIWGSLAGRLEFPPATHRPAIEGQEGLFEDSELPTYVTAGDALRGLRQKLDPVPSELAVGGKWGHLLPDVPPGDNYLFYTDKRNHPEPLFRWRSRYWTFLLKLSPDRPSWTIQAQPGPYVGPFHWENRRLTIAEMKRIQTFPDEYEFVGKRQSVQRQVGNAVPSKMGEVLGSVVIRQQKPQTTPVTA